MTMPRDTSILHRSATELVPESVLAGMERDGWTPTQVRALIASYRELARDVAELREETGMIGRGFVKNIKLREGHFRQCFAVVEKELRKIGTCSIGIYYFDKGASDTIRMDCRDGVGGQTAHGTLFEAFATLKKAKGGKGR